MIAGVIFLLQATPALASHKKTGRSAHHKVHHHKKPIPTTIVEVIEEAQDDLLLDDAVKKKAADNQSKRHRRAEGEAPTALPMEGATRAPMIEPEISTKSKKENIVIAEGEEPIVRVLMGGRRNGVLTVPMEEYLAGVIGNEMSSRWPVESLKAQAVAARSYALYGIKKARANGRSFDVYPTQADQVFRVRESQNSYLRDIVNMTRGQILTKHGQVLQAFYSSTCGGKTRTAESAGFKNSPLDKGCVDSYCKISPFRDWYLQFSFDQMERLLNQSGVPVHGLKDIFVKKFDKTGYVQSIMLRDEKNYRYMTGENFRRMVGSMKLKSLLFDIVSNDVIHIHGHGFGHGVGLCQYGAKAMALKNRNYKQILMKFYPKTTLSKIY